MPLAGSTAGLNLGPDLANPLHALEIWPPTGRFFALERYFRAPNCSGKALRPWREAQGRERQSTEKNGRAEPGLSERRQTMEDYCLVAPGRFVISKRSNSPVLSSDDFRVNTGCRASGPQAPV